MVVFTAAILDGLEGQAAAGPDGWITIRTLADFVQQQVSVWVKRNRPDHAKISLGIERRIEATAESIPLALHPDARRARRQAALERFKENQGAVLTGDHWNQTYVLLTGNEPSPQSERLLAAVEALDGSERMQRSLRDLLRELSGASPAKEGGNRSAQGGKSTQAATEPSQKSPSKPVPGPSHAVVSASDVQQRAVVPDSAHRPAASLARGLRSGLEFLADRWKGIVFLLVLATAFTAVRLGAQLGAVVAFLFSALLSASAAKTKAEENWPAGVEFDSLQNVVGSLLPIGVGPATTLWLFGIIEEAQKSGADRSLPTAIFAGLIAYPAVAGLFLAIVGFLLNLVLRLFDWEPTIPVGPWTVIAALAGAAMATPAAY